MSSCESILTSMVLKRSSVDGWYWLGVENFTFSPLESFDTEKAGRSRELELIKEFNTAWPNGLNFECGDGESAALSRTSKHTNWVRRKVAAGLLPPYPKGGYCERKERSLVEAQFVEWACFMKYLEAHGIECRLDFAYLEDAKRLNVAHSGFGLQVCRLPVSDKGVPR